MGPAMVTGAAIEILPVLPALPRRRPVRVFATAKLVESGFSSVVKLVPEGCNTAVPVVLSCRPLLAARLNPLAFKLILELEDVTLVPALWPIVFTPLELIKVV